MREESFDVRFEDGNGGERVLKTLDPFDAVHSANVLGATDITALDEDGSVIMEWARPEKGWEVPYIRPIEMLGMVPFRHVLFPDLSEEGIEFSDGVPRITPEGLRILDQGMALDFREWMTATWLNHPHSIPWRHVYNLDVSHGLSTGFLAEAVFGDLEQPRRSLASMRFDGYSAYESSGCRIVRFESGDHRSSMRVLVAEGEGKAHEPGTEGVPKRPTLESFGEDGSEGDDEEG